MKPAFALDFRDGAVALLHRTVRGWMAIGQTTFDSPDLDEALSFLRSTALGLSPGGMATKLIIPNDQILFTTVHAPGPDSAKRRRQIAARLEGLTPYKVEDLVYDWWGKGDEVQVAVIARETLAEAEAFAHQHRFNPVSFVGVPDNGLFQGEPWFGPTSVAASLLSPGEKVDRDQDPVRIMGREAAVAATAPKSEPAPEPAPETAPEPEPDLPEPELPEPMPPARPEISPEPDPQPAPAPLEVPQQHPEVEDLATDLPEVPFDPMLKADAAPEPVPAPFDKAPVGNGPVGNVSVDEAPMALDVDDDTPEDRPAESRGDRRDVGRDVGRDDGAENRTENRTENLRIDPGFAPPRNLPGAEDAPKPGALSILQAFASRRRGNETTETAAKPQGAPTFLQAEPRPESRPEPRVASAPAPGLQTPPQPLAAPKPLAPSAAEAPESSGMAVIGAASFAPVKTAPAPRLAAERPNLARPLPVPAGKSAAKTATAKGLKGFSALVSSPGTAGNRKARPPISASAMAAAQAAAANPTARPAGGTLGLGSRPVPPKRPRYLGLVLTGILLVLLMLVAAWSQFFLAANDSATTPDATAVAGLSAPLDAETPGATPAETPAVEDEMLADQQDPAEFDLTAEGADNLAAETPISEDPAAVAAQSALAQDATAEPGTEGPATAALADPATAAPETGLTGATTTTARNETSAPQDEIFLAAIDTPPQPPDPSALGSPEVRADGLPDPAVAPPPFGTVFQFDASGYIVPTPEGITTPEGVLLVAGKPPRVPTSRTAAVEAAVAAATAAAAVPAASADASADAGADAGAGADGGAGNPSTLPLDPAAPATASAATETSGANAAAAEVGAAEIVAPEAGAAGPVFADPALKDFRPVARPASLQVPSQNGTLEDPALAPDTGSRFASLRPQTRPAAIAALAAPDPAPADQTTDPQATIQTASLVANGQVLAADRSPLAVAVSRKPAARPADLSRAVEAAVAEANQQPAVELAAASTANTANPAPEADAEPEHDGTMPNLPTTASVAKQATVKDAVNLSKLTLIGIYGTSSSRYALVRQPNGRMVKVKVGDRLDGGKVAAITSTELTYQKSGRAVTLEMPRT